METIERKKDIWEFWQKRYAKVIKQRTLKVNGATVHKGKYDISLIFLNKQK